MDISLNNFYKYQIEHDKNIKEIIKRAQKGEKLEDFVCFVVDSSKLF